MLRWVDSSVGCWSLRFALLFGGAKLFYQYFRIWVLEIETCIVADWYSMREHEKRDLNTASLKQAKYLEGAKRALGSIFLWKRKMAKANSTEVCVKYDAQGSLLKSHRLAEGVALQYEYHIALGMVGF